jgi:hypothetical protein
MSESWRGTGSAVEEREKSLFQEKKSVKLKDRRISNQTTNTKNLFSYERWNKAIYKSTREKWNFYHYIKDHYRQKCTKANLILYSAQSSEDQAIEDYKQKQQDN